MVSIKDVAKLAGVSVMTASRVVNRAGSASPAAHAAVLKAVEELGYRPNLTARSLRAKQTHLIGLLIPDIENPVFSSLAKYVEVEAQGRGYNVMLGNTWEDPGREADYLDIMYARRLDGIIISPVSGENRERIRDCRVPVVCLDRVFTGRGAPPAVTVDNLMVGRLAARHLLETGRRRFACITGPGHIGVFANRLEGFRRELAAAGCAAPAVRVVTTTGRVGAGMAEAEEVFSARSRRPLAVFCANDVVAMGAMKAAARMGLSIPGDVAVVGVDDIPAAELYSPSLTTIRQPVQEMAAKGVGVLLGLLAGGKARHAGTVLRPELVVRESTR